MQYNAKLVERLLVEEPALVSSRELGPLVKQGSHVGPAILIGDMSEINLVGTAPSSHLEYRMAHLARTGDVVLLRNNDPLFEVYLKDHCGLDGVSFVHVDPFCNDPVAKQAFESKELLAKLVRFSKKHGGVCVNSYLTTQSTWRLAQEISQASGTVVHVNGPSPRVSRRVNDKLWFTRLSREILGNSAIPPTMSAYGPHAAAALVRRLVQGNRQVVVKIPDSAGSAGNIRLEQDAIKAFTRHQIETLLLSQLHATGWADDYPILVGVWDENVLCSPSVQTWIPHTAEGPPLSNGVFEQKVLGTAEAFVGAERSELPDLIQVQLVEQALSIANVLQQLGYYGNCSFDAVICSDVDGVPSIHWIECNGRWTGVSIPLAVQNLIAPDQPPQGMLVMQTELGDEPLSTAVAVQALGAILHPSSDSNEGVILLSPTSGPARAFANLLVLAGTKSDAKRLGGEALRVLGNAAIGP